MSVVTGSKMCAEFHFQLVSPQNIYFAPPPLVNKKKIFEDCFLDLLWLFCAII